MLVQIKRLLMHAKSRLGIFAGDERGDFGIGQIAAIVAGIVIVGVIITIITGSMGDWIEQVWTWVTELFNNATP